MEKFYFTTEQLENTPSTKDGIFIDDEIKYRVKIATFLQALGEKLKTYPFQNYNQYLRLCLIDCVYYLIW